MGKKTFQKMDIVNLIGGDLADGLELVEKGQWIDEGKCQFQEVIIQEVATGKFYCYGNSKSGSYFSEVTSGWEYEPDEIELDEVEQRQKIIEVWETV